VPPAPPAAIGVLVCEADAVALALPFDDATGLVAVGCIVALLEAAGVVMVGADVGPVALDPALVLAVGVPVADVASEPCELGSVRGADASSVLGDEHATVERVASASKRIRDDIGRRSWVVCLAKCSRRTGNGPGTRLRKHSKPCRL
jgi:hypothetical protein